MPVYIRGLVCGHGVWISMLGVSTQALGWVTHAGGNRVNFCAWHKFFGLCELWGVRKFGRRTQVDKLGLPHGLFEAMGGRTVGSVHADGVVEASGGAGRTVGWSCFSDRVLWDV